MKKSPSPKRAKRHGIWYCFCYSENGKIRVQIPIILGCFVLIFVGYHLYQTYTRPSNQLPPTGISPTPSGPSTTQPTLSPLTTDFQKLLAQKCVKNTRYENGIVQTFYEIPISDLPISIDQTKVPIRFPYLHSLSCKQELPNHADVRLITPQQPPEPNAVTMYIWDKDSQEEGQGLPPWYASPPQWSLPIYKTNDTVIYAHIGGVMWYKLGLMYVGIHAVKTIHQTNGDDIYVTYLQEAIPARDNRLATLFTKYVKQASDGAYYLDDSKGSDCIQDIKKTFFADMSSLANPEKDVITHVLTVLNGFKAK